VASEVPSTVLSAEGLAGRPLVIDVVAGTDLVASKGEARRAIEQGGIFVNDVPRLGLDATLGPDDLLHGRYLVLRKGKRSYHLISVQ
jgi:tyrosyl-tRNA synthetase